MTLYVPQAVMDLIEAERARGGDLRGDYRVITDKPTPQDVKQYARDVDAWVAAGSPKDSVPALGHVHEYRLRLVCDCGAHQEGRPWRDEERGS